MGIRSKLFNVKNRSIDMFMMAMSEEDAIRSFQQSYLPDGKIVAKFIADIEVLGGLSASNFLIHPTYVLPDGSECTEGPAISEELFDLLPMYP